MRAMALAFPGNALTRGYETQFMCGDTLLVAPVLQAGGEVEIALPPGAWYDLISRQRFPGQRVLRYKAALDQFPVFGREGYALPMGLAVQHTGEIDAAKPLEQLWVFGKPTRPFHGFLQANIVEAADGTLRDRRRGRRQGRAVRRCIAASSSPSCRTDGAGADCAASHYRDQRGRARRHRAGARRAARRACTASALRGPSRHRRRSRIS